MKRIQDAGNPSEERDAEMFKNIQIAARGQQVLLPGASTPGIFLWRSTSQNAQGS